jgi:hypothetical protein
MKPVILVLCSLIAGCAMTPTQKKYAAVGASFLVIGFVAAHDSRHGTTVPHDIAGPRGPCPSDPKTCQ